MKEWPTSVPVIDQQELDEFPYRYSRISRHYSGAWGILYQIFPNHIRQAIDAYILIFTASPFLSRSIGRAMMINLTLCQLGYTEGQSQDTLQLFLQLKETYANQTHYRISRARISTQNERVRVRSPKAITVHQRSNAGSNDDKILLARTHLAASIGLWRPSPKRREQLK
jgi:hypothetical protein